MKEAYLAEWMAVRKVLWWADSRVGLKVECWVASKVLMMVDLSAVHLG